MSRIKDSGNRLVVGGPPRADLLPPEVGEKARARRARGMGITMVVLSVVAVLVGTGVAVYFSIVAQAQLAAANDRTQEILLEQQQYSEVRHVTGLIDTARSARVVATSTEVDWKRYLAAVQASLPAGTLVTSVTAEFATPLTDYSQPSVPLQGARLGMLDFTATSPSLPDIEEWLAGLSELPGFVDATPRAVTLNEEDGTYTVQIVMHVDEGALVGRYAEDRGGWTDVDAVANTPAAPEESDADAADAGDAVDDATEEEGN